MPAVLTSVTVSNGSPVNLTKIGALTFAEANALPGWRIQRIPLNTNMVSSSITISGVSSASVSVREQIAAEGEVVPITSTGQIILARGLAALLPAVGTLTLYDCNSPNATLRRSYPSYFPVSASATVFKGALNYDYFVTMVVSPAKNGNTWTWPAFSVEISLTGDYDTSDQQIYPYRRLEL